MLCRKSRTVVIRLLPLLVLFLAMAPLVAVAHEVGGPLEVEPEGDKDHRANPPHGSLGNVGAKLANPLSNLWSLSMNFQAPGFYDGDVNAGSPEVGGNLILQPGTSRIPT